MISPRTALHDPVFRAYLIIVPVSLALGGAILGFLRWGLKKELGSIWKTYRSWLVMASIGLLVVFAGRVPVIVGVILLSTFGFKEFARASGLYRDRWMAGAVYAGIVTVGIAALMPPPRREGPGASWYGFFMAVPVFVIALILLIPILRNRAPVAKHVVEHRRFYLHRLDVWTFGFSRESDECLRISLLRYFCDRIE